MQSSRSIISKPKSYQRPIRQQVPSQSKSYKCTKEFTEEKKRDLQTIISLIIETDDYSNEKNMNFIIQKIRDFNGVTVDINIIKHLLLRFLLEIRKFNQKKEYNQINKIRLITQRMQEEAADSLYCYSDQSNFKYYVDNEIIKKTEDSQKKQTIICVNALSVSQYAHKILEDNGYFDDETTGGSKKTKQFSKKYIPKHLTEKDKKKQSDMLKKSIKMYEKKQYINRNRVESFKARKSPHIKKAKELYNVKKISPNRQLAKATGCSVKALSDIVKKGQGAYYSSGSRPNQTAHSWGIARLASAITAGKSAKVDYHILEKGCDKKKKALQLAKNLQKK